MQEEDFECAQRVPYAPYTPLATAVSSVLRPVQQGLSSDSRVTAYFEPGTDYIYEHHVLGSELLKLGPEVGALLAGITIENNADMCDSVVEQGAE